MPHYDYQCPACGTTFDVYHSMKEHPEVVCPECGIPARRVLSASGIVLKGSGFYNTDQRNSHSHTDSHTQKPAETETKADTQTSDAAGESQTCESTDTQKPASEQTPAEKAEITQTSCEDTHKSDRHSCQAQDTSS